MSERHGGRRGARRASVRGVAGLLGIGNDAVVTRVRGGTLHPEKTDDQMVHGWLGEALDSDQNGPLREKAEDIEKLREQVCLLREVLDEDQGIGGREGRILARLTQATASLAPLTSELKTAAPRTRPELVKPAVEKTSQLQSA